MRTSFNRRTATKVKDGRVQRKNRHAPTVLLGCALYRESPGHGFRHVLTKRDVEAFINIIPEWQKFSQRLERIVLAGDSPDDGYYQFYTREETGGIFLHAWAEGLWTELPTHYFDAHQEILERFGVSYDRLPEEVVCRFTIAQARAFMLLHVFMHELGHHYDRCGRKRRGYTAGEEYAEKFATSRFEQLLPAYVRVFGDPRKGT